MNLMSRKKKAKKTKSTAVSSQPGKKEAPWPWLFSINPRVLIAVIATWLLFAWFLFMSVDIWQIFGQGLERPMWTHLFNDKPVEWTQWFLLAFAIVLSGYLAARLDMENKKQTAKFFFLFAIALGLMLIEEAGDIRHVISWEVHRFIDSDKIFGLPYRSMTDLPYFAALAAVPLYAVARYGRAVWDASVRARKFFITGFVFYAVSAIGSGARYIGDFYVRAGTWLDNNLFMGRFPSAHDHTQETTYLMIIDAPVEESLELLAITFMTVAILVFAADFRRRRVEKEEKLTIE